MRITNDDKYISSWLVTARIEELKAENQDFLREVESTEAQIEEERAAGADDERIDALRSLLDGVRRHWRDWLDDEGEELAALLELEELCRDSGDWSRGCVLIRHSALRDYAVECAEDMGCRVDEWPCTAIDWDKAVNDLLTDCIDIDFNGVTYYQRA